MGYILTGYARSLTVEIIKKINNIVQPGYPKNYDGKNDAGFILAYPQYNIITDEEMSRLFLTDFNLRLTDFKNWLESIEVTLNFSTDTIIESRILSELCEITTTTTTTLEPTTTTTLEPTTTTTLEPTTTTTTTESIYFYIGDFFICGDCINPIGINIEFKSEIPLIIDKYYKFTYLTISQILHVTSIGGTGLEGFITTNDIFNTCEEIVCHPITTTTTTESP